MCFLQDDLGYEAPACGDVAVRRAGAEDPHHDVGLAVNRAGAEDPHRGVVVMNHETSHALVAPQGRTAPFGLHGGRDVEPFAMAMFPRAA